MTDLNLDLRVTFGADGGCEVTAEESGAGRAGPERLDQRTLEEPAFLADLAHIRAAAGRTPAGQALRRTGEALFRVLFTGEVLHLFSGLMDQAARRDEETRLHVRLDIDERAGGIASLPWELMLWRDAPLATHARTLLSRRYASVEYGVVRPVGVAGKPRVLVVIPGGSGLQTDAERTVVSAALTRGGLPFDLLEGKVTLGRLDDLLAAHPYHVLHFVGHGAEATEADGSLAGYLRFNAPEAAVADSDEEWVEHRRLQALLATHASLRLVILNACQTAAAATPGSGSASRSFRGLVPAILRAGVPAALAMQYPVRDDVAVQFASTFYERLANGRWRGQVETAVALARNACYLHFPEDPGFATPVLFLRGREASLFDFGPEDEVTQKADPAALAPEAIDLLIGQLSGRNREATGRGAAVRAVLETAAGANPGWAEALGDLAAAPEDDDNRATARVHLKKLLTRDEGLAREIHRLMHADEPALPGAGVQVAGGDRSILAGRKVNITGTVITGDIHGDVTIGKGK